MHVHNHFYYNLTLYLYNYLPGDFIFFALPITLQLLHSLVIPLVTISQSKFQILCMQFSQISNIF